MPLGGVTVLLWSLASDRELLGLASGHTVWQGRRGVSLGRGACAGVLAVLSGSQPLTRVVVAAVAALLGLVLGGESQ